MPLQRSDIFRLPWQATITDATGSRRSCAMILRRSALSAYPCTLPPDDARRAIRCLRRAVALPWVISTLLYTLVISVYMLRTAMTSTPAADAADVILSMGITAAIIALYLTIGTAPAAMAYRRAHAAHLIAARRCPWCLYDLSGTPKDHHDLTTCPECGGRWRLPTPSPEV